MMIVKAKLSDNNKSEPLSLTMGEGGASLLGLPRVWMPHRFLLAQPFWSL